jgi:uncharacterized iron-regulated protein
MSAALVAALVFVVVCGAFVNPLAAADPVIVDVLTGEPITREALIDDLASVRIVYFGEIHTIDRHHRIHAETLKALHDRGLELALGMEMFPASKQPVLDQWQTSSDSVHDLMIALGETYWTNLFDYAPLLLAARELGIPILGLNADDDLVKMVARNGPEGLREEDRSRIPEGTEIINPQNDRLLRLKLRVHKAFQDKSLDRIVLAQALRDETMARTVTDYLESAEGMGRVMFVVAGSGHLNYGFGIPERVHRRNPFNYRIVLPSESGELVLSEAEKGQAVQIEISHEDLRFIRAPIADYLHVTPLKKKPEPEPDREPGSDIDPSITRRDDSTVRSM